MAEYIDTSINPADYIEVWEAEDTEHGKQLVMAVDDLKCLPPADVRPVVRGQWKFATNPMLHDGPGPSCWCSECKKPPIDKKNVWYHLDGTFAREGEEFVLSDFCPNCGADMRGGDADGEEKD